MVLDHFNCRPEVLIAAVSRFASKKVLVLGDVMLDRFVWGSVSRISPEAPVPVVQILKETSCLGGAANVAANIRSLGGIPFPLTVVGKDPEGADLRARFKQLSMPSSGILIDNERATSVKTRIIAHHQQVCRTDREDRMPLSREIRSRIIRCFRRHLDEMDAVIVSDYAKGLISPELLKNLLPTARDAGKVICVDPKLRDLGAYRPATVITPNLAEAELASGMSIQTDRELIAAGKKILGQTGIDHLLITRGEHGMALFEGNDHAKVTRIPTVAREVYDVTGAGDTVISTLALGLVSGLSILESAVLANIAAGIVVGKLGTASVSPEELIGKIHQTG
jgi:D-beta-D-heptose 7-phosphate kinase/D-beta-D-heptose 1-phosphate adenosyltransferase